MLNDWSALSTVIKKYRSRLFLFLHDIHRWCCCFFFTLKRLYKKKYMEMNWRFEENNCFYYFRCSKKTKQIDRLKSDKFLFLTLLCLGQGVKFNVLTSVRKKSEWIIIVMIIIIFNSIQSSSLISIKAIWTNDRQKKITNVKKYPIHSFFIIVIMSSGNSLKSFIR